jgi:hypothetical protein
LRAVLALTPAASAASVSATPYSRTRLAIVALPFGPRGALRMKVKSTSR